MLRGLAQGGLAWTISSFVYIIDKASVFILSLERKSLWTSFFQPNLKCFILPLDVMECH